MQINENGSNCIVDRDNRLSYCEINAPELTVPSGVKFVGRSVMMHNKKLKRLVIPEGVESIEPYAFADCPSLTEIVLPSTLKKIEGYSFDSCVALKSVVLPDGLEYLGDNAFAFCMSLKSIYVPASVNAFGMTPFAARSPGLTFHVPAGSYAEEFFKKRDYKVDNKIPASHGGFYAPGCEPEKTKLALERFFAKIDELYPDKCVCRLHSDYKDLGKALKRLYTALGYSDGPSMLEAYGYTVKNDSPGRKKGNPEEVITELKKRYIKGPTCKNMNDLVAQNPDLESRFSNLKMRSNELFGMSLKKYLVQENILLAKA